MSHYQESEAEWRDRINKIRDDIKALVAEEVEDMGEHELVKYHKFLSSRNEVVELIQMLNNLPDV